MLWTLKEIENLNKQDSMIWKTNLKRKLFLKEILIKSIISLQIWSSIVIETNLHSEAVTHKTLMVKIISRMKATDK